MKKMGSRFGISKGIHYLTCKLVVVMVGFMMVLNTSILANSLNDMVLQWDALLKTYVHPGVVNSVTAHLVDYDGLSRDVRFNTLLETVSLVDYRELLKMEEILTFWVNVYNIAAVNLVLTHPGITSIKEAGSFVRPVWDQSAIRVLDRSVSLDDIKTTLRKTGVSDIHFGIVDTSVSCPDLRMEAYAPDRVRVQLADNKLRFFQNFTKGVDVNMPRLTLYVSRLFDWFESDFKGTSGVYALVESELSVDLTEFKLAYLPYDWSLNSLARGRGGRR